MSAYPADTLTVLFGGDVLFDRGVRTVVEGRGYDYVFADIAPVMAKAGASVVNLECPLTMRHRKVHKKYIFRADTLAAAAMHRASITHAAMANNHSMDQGLIGLSDTYDCLRRHGITPLGYATRSDSLLQPTLISARGVDIAVFNAVTVPIENWFTTPSANKPAICYTSINKLAAAVRRYHAEHPAVSIVVFIHWGQEFRDSPTLQQRLDAATLVGAGATAVIGQHPHVLQTHEMMGTAPVWYSIGNLVFDQKPEKCNKAQLIMLRFTAEGLADYTALPIDIVNCRPRLSRSQD